TSNSPDSSTRVSTTLVPTPSATPRKLMSMTTSRNAAATANRTGLVGSGESPPPNAVSMFTAKARDAVVEDVMPELITVNSTMNVTKWTPKALRTYSAAPAAPHTVSPGRSARAGGGAGGTTGGGAFRV